MLSLSIISFFGSNNCVDVNKEISFLCVSTSFSSHLSNPHVFSSRVSNVAHSDSSAYWFKTWSFFARSKHTSTGSVRILRHPSRTGRTSQLLQIFEILSRRLPSNIELSILHTSSIWVGLYTNWISSISA